MLFSVQRNRTGNTRALLTSFSPYCTEIPARGTVCLAGVNGHCLLWIRVSHGHGWVG